MIEFNINDRKVQARQGWTILETARHYGVDIPTLCYHEAVAPSGACSSVWWKSKRVTGPNWWPPVSTRCRRESMYTPRQSGFKTSDVGSSKCCWQPVLPAMRSRKWQQNMVSYPRDSQYMIPNRPAWFADCVPVYAKRWWGFRLYPP